MKLEQIQKFHEFLQTDLNMFEDEAFEVIYYLQEVLHIIPDKFEMCSECGSIYDTDCGGYFSKKAGKHYCYWCDTEERDEM
ncbi:MAG: hypothetical protein ACOCRO_09680 [Halanaerobiales bacterium]